MEAGLINLVFRIFVLLEMSFSELNYSDFVKLSAFSANVIINLFEVRWKFFNYSGYSSTLILGILIS